MRRWVSRLLGRQEMRERLMLLEAQLARLADASAALRAELAATRAELGAARAEHAAALAGLAAAQDAAQRRSAETVVAQVEEALAGHVHRLDGYMVHHAERILAALPALRPAEDRGPGAEAAARPVDFSRG